MTQDYAANRRPRENLGGKTEFGDGGLGLMTPGEVAAVLHVDANTVARWSDNGKLRAVRTPGGHRRYFTTEVLHIARSGLS